jgi:hypothetical protein
VRRSHRRFYRCLEDFQPGLVADRNAVPRLTEGWAFGSNALSYELRVVLRFLPGLALMSEDVLGWKLADQIKEKPFHRAHNATPKCLFPHKKLTVAPVGDQDASAGMAKNERAHRAQFAERDFFRPLLKPRATTLLPE